MATLMPQPPKQKILWALLVPTWGSVFGVWVDG